MPLHPQLLSNLRLERRVPHQAGDGRAEREVGVQRRPRGRIRRKVDCTLTRADESGAVVPQRVRRGDRAPEAVRRRFILGDLERPLEKREYLVDVVSPDRQLGCPL